MTKTTGIGGVTGREGDWVVVVKGEVVASCEHSREAFELADGHPREETVVTKILHPQASFY